jgi:hypothetical protein
VADRKQLNPGDLVLGLGEDINLRMRSGVIVAVAVSHGGNREHHFGCEHRLLVLWNEPCAHLVEECDCGIMVPLELGL